MPQAGVKRGGRRRAELGLGPGATIVLLSTEGSAANPHAPPGG
jgi:diaminopropionate ammonia-lyase